MTTSGSSEMSVIRWLKSRFLVNKKAALYYRRGMMQARLHKNQGAIADYTAVIELADVTGPLRAMALYNRALVHHATGNDAGAIQDLNRILEMTEVASDVKTAARRKLIRMERASSRVRARDGGEY
jgi:hypothetical protein